MCKHSLVTMLKSLGSGSAIQLNIGWPIRIKELYSRKNMNKLMCYFYKPGAMQLANSSGITIDSICYYELTNYVLLLYNRVVLGYTIILLANSRISYFMKFS